jgi:hypothetical protein
MTSIRGGIDESLRGAIRMMMRPDTLASTLIEEITRASLDLLLRLRLCKHVCLTYELLCSLSLAHGNMSKHRYGMEDFLKPESDGKEYLNHYNTDVGARFATTSTTKRPLGRTLAFLKYPNGTSHRVARRASTTEVFESKVHEERRINEQLIV